MNKLQLFTMILLIVCAQTAFPNVPKTVVKGNVIFVLDGLNTEKTTKYINQLKSFVWDADIRVTSLEDLPKSSSTAKRSIIIAIGPKAFSNALDRKSNIPIVSVFTSRTLYYKIKEQHHSNYRKTTAIFADSDLNDQIALITGIYNRSISVGVLLTQPNLGYKSELILLADEYEIKIHIEILQSGNDIYRSLNTLTAKGVDAILAIPDADIFNKSTMPGIVLSTYKNDQSIIGFSDKLVQAGSLASVYYLPKHVAIDTNSIVSVYFSNGYIGEEHFSKNFNVAVNKSVARSLNLYKNNPTELVSRVKKNVNFKDKSFEFVFMDSRTTETVL